MGKSKLAIIVGIVFLPPQPQVGRREIDQIVVYLRELQKANGID